MTEITAVNDKGEACRAYYMKGRKPGADGKLAGYRCFPPSCNDAGQSLSFETSEEAAAFLRANRDWGIRMNPGSAIFTDIMIDGKPR